MATNTGIRKCKNKDCGAEFEKKYSLQAYCSPYCEVKNKQGSYKAKSYKKPKKVEKKVVKKIKQLSNKNTAECSDGTRYNSVQIDAKIRQAKEKKKEEMLDEFGYIFCEDCAEFGVPPNVPSMALKIIDCSHEIGVDLAKKTKITELCWYVPNIRMRCRHHHNIHDKLK